MDVLYINTELGIADAEIGELARLYVDEVETTRGLKTKIAPIFEKRDVPSELQEEYDKIVACVKDAPHFEEYDYLKNYIVEQTGLKEENIFKPLRILLSNAENGPDLEDIYKYLKNYLGEFVQ